MNSIIKYSIFLYVILGFLFFYEINLFLNTKNVLEKRVKGVSTQIKEIENYQNNISDFTTDY